ncbi:MAG: enoyl-CoA hydratase-related protein, partial [Dermatophilaceae bacterium]
MTASTPSDEVPGDEMIRYERDGTVVVLTMDDPASSANTMTGAYIASMGRAVDRLEAERDEITGVVLASAKKTWFAGADLSDLQATTPEMAVDFFSRVERVKADLRRLERLGRPVVAALHGTALGGGFEIALACHRRIAVDDDRIRFGLPEVTFGLLPGGGGITRTVRMLGLTEALTQWLLEGRTRTPRQTVAGGLVDELVATPDELIPAATAWITAHADDPDAAIRRWDRPDYRMPGGAPASPALATILPGLPARLRRRLRGADLRAPRAILAAAVEGAQVDVDTATRIESRHLTELVTGRQSAAMIQAFFFDLQAIRSGANRPAGIERRAVRRVGVLGAGMMGAGIAYACAARGIEVVLKDVDLERAMAGKASAERVSARRGAAGPTTDAETV